MTAVEPLPSVSSTNKEESIKPRFVGECRHVKLNEICSKGKSSLRQKDVFNDGPYSVYGASGVVGTTSDYQNEIPYVAVVKDGAGVGRTNACEPMTSVLGTMQALIPNPNVERDYLLHLVRSLRLGEGFSGSTIPHIYFKDYGRIEVPLPPLEAQKQIVSQLGLVEAQITQAEAQIEQLEHLVKSQFVEMFEHPSDKQRYVKLESILREPASNGFFAKRADYTDAGNVYVLGVANAVNRMYSKVDNLPKTNASLKDIEKYSLSYGDMLFCRSSLVSEGVGKASIVPIDVRPQTLFECHIIRMPLNLDVCIPEFMQIQTTMGPFRKQVISKAKTATMTTIDQKSLLQCDVFLPPIEQQRSFRAFIRQVDKLRFKTQQQIKKLEMLKNSLMQEYFGQ